MREWKHISEVAKETEVYLDKRRKGEIRSLFTGFHKLDAAGIGGIEWGSIVVIGARPSIGKSAFSDCLIFSALENNEQGFDILDFSWEMSPGIIMVRRMSAEMQRSYKYICSADGNSLSEEEMKKISYSLRSKYSNYPIYFVDKPDTPQGFADTVRKFRDESRRNVLVRIDHTMLVQKSETGDSVAVLYNLLSKANEIKKEGNTTFLLLTQLNREFEKRQVPRSNLAFPVQSDVFGADATAQFAEMMILLNRPSKHNITYYGQSPNGWVAENHDIFAHIVKSRNAEPNLIIRYRENFENMSILEL